MTVSLKVRKHLPAHAIRAIDELIELQKDLNMIRERTRKAVGKIRGLMPEFKAYTDPWLKSFAEDPDQSGSIESLIRDILSEYVDDDGEPWEDD